MSRITQSAQVVCASITLFVSVPGWTAAAQPPEPGALLDTFAKEDSSSYFALRLSPTITRPLRHATDVVILFDTSASQAGAYRDKALAALESTLAALAPTDRVRLFAVDLNAIPLMEKFATAGGPETRQALAALRGRVPLGATDMAGVLAATGDCFAAGQDATRGHAALYIGDGMSTANLLHSDAARPLFDRLVAEHVPMSSYAVGPRVDSSLLACLANQTGGVMAVDGENLTGAQVGNWLAAAVQAPVVWPERIQLPDSLSSVSGDKAIPLRFDRDTILVGKGQLTEPAVVKMNAESEGRTQELTWQLNPTSPNPDYAFLETLVESASHDGGLSLPTLGSQGLTEARRMMQDDAQGLNRLS
ncbi:MAG TPA: hypothetical protein VGG64_03515, partial [Pirellulales bacterium]